MGGTGKGRVSASARPVLVLTILSFILSAGLVALPARAADDSNSGQLTPSPTVNPQDLNAALSSLAQGTNDSQMQQLLSQFQSELNSGDLNSASSTLLQLQGLSNSQGGSSPALNALLNSLTIGDNGASINANTLASILNSTSSSSSESPQRLSVDMQTLASLMQLASPTLASQLLQDSSSLSQSAFGASAKSGGGSISFPGLSGFSGLSVPSVGTPSVGGGGGFGIPSVSPEMLAFPAITIGAVAAVYLSRKRLARLMSVQRMPGVPLARNSGVETAPLKAPSDPRGRIEFYFWKTVRVMDRRGVPKTDSETHREFASKVSSRPEEPDVRTISSLYEKAKFSGQGVGNPDADAARSALSRIGEDVA